jgi:hypothetical protein
MAKNSHHDGAPTPGTSVRPRTAAALHGRNNDNPNNRAAHIKAATSDDRARAISVPHNTKKKSRIQKNLDYVHPCLS